MDCRFNVAARKVIAPFEVFALVPNTEGTTFVFVVTDGEEDISRVATAQEETGRVGFRGQILCKTNRWLAGKRRPGLMMRRVGLIYHRHFIRQKRELSPVDETWILSSNGYEKISFVKCHHTLEKDNLDLDCIISDSVRAGAAGL